MSSPRIDNREVCIMHTSFYVHLYMYAILKSVHLYRPPLLPAGFKKCTPIPATASAGNLSKMHTYIYPVLSCCKKCIPIPATTAVSRFQKVCTYTGHNNSRQPPSKSVHLYRPSLSPATFQKCTPIYTPFCLVANCVYLYQPRHLPASFSNCVHLYVPRRRPRFAGSPHALSGYALKLWPV